MSITSDPSTQALVNLLQGLDHPHKDILASVLVLSRLARTGHPTACTILRSLDDSLRRSPYGQALFQSLWALKAQLQPGALYSNELAQLLFSVDALFAQLAQKPPGLACNRQQPCQEDCAHAVEETEPLACSSWNVLGQALASAGD